MKKFIASLTAAAMLLTAAPFAAHAEGNPDLASLAAEHGALNYAFPNLPSDYKIYPDQTIVPVPINTAEYAMAVMTVLANTQVIAPSDILPNAASFGDLVPCDEVNRIINGYADTGCNSAIALGYGTVYCNTSDKILKTILMWSSSDIVDPAGEDDDRYVLVNLIKKTDDIPEIHPVVVIGMTEGEWSFKDKTYNVCLLTLDPAAGNKFMEERCIYLNSNDGDMYVPAYGISDDNGGIFAMANVEEALNYNGPINPTTDPKELEEAENFQYLKAGFSGNWKYDITIDNTKKDRETYSAITKDGPPEKMVENYYYSKDREYAAFTMKSEIELDIDSADEEYDRNAIFGISTQTVHRESIIASREKAHINMNEDTIRITHYPFDTTDLSNDEIRRRETFGAFFKDLDTPDGIDFNYNGCTSGTTELKFTAKGIMITDTDTIRGFVMPDEYAGSNDPETLHFTAIAPVMLKYNEQDNKWALFRDAGDGTFGEAIRKGDVNSDGCIDSADASLVLETYALTSTGSKNVYVDLEYGDFNGDGILDSSDASAILAYYAEVSTGSKK